MSFIPFVSSIRCLESLANAGRKSVRREVLWWVPVGPGFLWNPEKPQASDSSCTEHKSDVPLWTRDSLIWAPLQKFSNQMEVRYGDAEKGTHQKKFFYCLIRTWALFSWDVRVLGQMQKWRGDFGLIVYLAYGNQSKHFKHLNTKVRFWVRVKSHCLSK